MADFKYEFIGWLISFATVGGIIALLILTWKLSHQKKLDKDEQAESMGHVWDGSLHELNNPLPRWWLNLFYITIAWGAVYLVLYPGLGAFPGTLGWSAEGQYDEEIAVAEAEYGPIFEKFLADDLSVVVHNDEALKIGQRLFSTYCTTCHGSDAGGARGFPNLRDNDWLYGGEPEAIKVSILNGRAGVMPPWEQILEYEGVFNVTAYVQQLAGHDADEQVVYKGKQIYDQNCAVCHGAEGKGNQQLGAPNLTDDIWLYGGSQKKIIESIAKGRNGNMPPHEEFLGEAKVHLLAAYVYNLSKDKAE